MSRVNRWEQFYRGDPRVLNAPPSHCARYAAGFFTGHGVRSVLDVGCGNARDSAVLASAGLAVVACDQAMTCLLQAHCAQAGAALARADARHLPFTTGSFDAAYCFGLLHEFTGAAAANAVTETVAEIARVVRADGYVVLAVLAGDPTEGLPHVQLFTEAMLDRVMVGFHAIEKNLTNDRGCTGSTDYRVWRGTYRRR